MFRGCKFMGGLIVDCSLPVLDKKEARQRDERRHGSYVCAKEAWVHCYWRVQGARLADYMHALSTIRIHDCVSIEA
jgi:hypothetical protein